MSTNLITHLRNATQQVHKKLEALDVSKLIMSPDIRVGGYITYLHKVYTIHQSIEENVFPLVKDLVTDIQAREKKSMLVHDLTALHADVRTVGVFLDSGFRNTPEFCMGMLYVSEGSTLGGQYILKNIQKVLGEQASTATTFLNAYGPRTGSMWKAFTEQLGNYEQTLTETQIQEVAAGAVYGFSRTGALFNMD